jgi:hypothetical protein
VILSISALQIAGITGMCCNPDPIFFFHGRIKNNFLPSLRPRSGFSKSMSFKELIERGKLILKLRELEKKITQPNYFGYFI